MGYNFQIMVKKGKSKKGTARPKTAVTRKPVNTLLDVDRPSTACPETAKAFQALKAEIYGMSLYQQIARPNSVSYFRSIPAAAMRVPLGGGEKKGGKGKGKKGKKK